MRLKTIANGLHRSPDSSLSTNPLRSKGTHVPAAGSFRLPKLSAALIRNGMMAAIIAFTSFHLAAAQEAAPNTDATSDTQSVHPNSVYYPSPDAIMGFESPVPLGRLGSKR